MSMGCDNDRRSVLDENRRGVHVHDILDLFPPVSNTEFSFFQLLRHLLLTIGILSGEVLHVFHEALDVTHAQKFRDEGLR